MIVSFPRINTYTYIFLHEWVVTIFSNMKHTTVLHRVNLRVLQTCKEINLSRSMYVCIFFTLHKEEITCLPNILNA